MDESILIEISLSSTEKLHIKKDRVTNLLSFLATHALKQGGFYVTKQGCLSYHIHPWKQEFFMPYGYILLALGSTLFFSFIYSNTKCLLIVPFFSFLAIKFFFLLVGMWAWSESQYFNYHTILHNLLNALMLQQKSKLKNKYWNKINIRLKKKEEEIDSY